MINAIPPLEQVLHFVGRRSVMGLLVQMVAAVISCKVVCSPQIVAMSAVAQVGVLRYPPVLVILMRDPVLLITVV